MQAVPRQKNVKLREAEERKGRIQGDESICTFGQFTLAKLKTFCLLVYACRKQFFSLAGLKKVIQRVFILKI